MLAIRSLFLVVLFASWTAAKPIDKIHKLRLERRDSELDILARQELTQPVTFQTVTTTQTQAGTIVQTCTITLTPETAQDGSQAVREDKRCKFHVDTSNGSSPPSNGNGSGSLPPSNGNGSGNSSSESTTGAISSSTATATQIQDTNTVGTSTTSSSATATAAPPISVIGVNTTSASQADTETASVPQPVTTTNEPALSVTATSQVITSATGTTSPASSAPATTPVTVLTTLSDGSVSTSVSTPSAAAAQEAAATTPGRKLEVLPIGLGVFAGVSVIALIVVGLVTYERTKYRKAFRQRKLAEAGANLGYGGMAERT